SLPWASAAIPPAKPSVSRAVRGAGCDNTDMVARPYRACPAKGTGRALTRAAPTTAACCAQSRMRAYSGAVETPRDAVAPQSYGLGFSAALSGFILRRRHSARPSHVLMSAFIACPPIERRHARQRIAKKPSRQIARLKLGAAIAIRQRQRTRPNARREQETSGLAVASDVIHDFGHCSFPRTASPRCRSPTARQHLGQSVTTACPN